MSDNLCKHCMTPLDFGIDECGCDGERIEKLEAENKRLRDELCKIRELADAGNAKLSAIADRADAALKGSGNE